MTSEFVREDVGFGSGGETCAAWFYRPQGEDPHPCVVMAHGWAGVREARLDAYAERFADAGLAVLLFDYRYFGASSGEPRQLIDVHRQHEDWTAAIAFARQLEAVDADALALWGTSFAGGHVIEIAAADHRVAAAIAQCPAADMRAALLKLPPRNAIRMAFAGIADRVAGLLGRPARYMPAVGPPGTFAAMTAPEAYPGYLALIPEDSTWRNEFAPRVALGLIFYRPIRRAPTVSCPVLVCVCDHDETTLPEPAVALAERLPRGEAIHYDSGHFDIYVGDVFEQAVTDQTEFLSRHLLRVPVAA